MLVVLHDMNNNNKKIIAGDTGLLAFECLLRLTRPCWSPSTTCFYLTLYVRTAFAYLSGKSDFFHAKTSRKRVINWVFFSDKINPILSPSTFSTGPQKYDACSCFHSSTSSKRIERIWFQTHSWNKLV